MPNKYPQGKLDETDEGELTMKVYRKEDTVILDFGKDLSWIGFDKKSLLALIGELSQKYREL
jgi:hypothetical protein